MAAIYYFFTSYWWRHANIVNCKKLSLSVNTVYHNTVIGCHLKKIYCQKISIERQCAYYYKKRA
jgi:hypothetical protein